MLVDFFSVLEVVFFAMNSAFLSFYYLCKIKRKMSNETFSAKFEWKIHAFIIISNLIVNFTALGLGSLGANVNGMFCSYARFPTVCRDNAELYGECSEPRSTNAEFIIIVVTSLLLVSLIGIIVYMVSILWHVTVVRDRMSLPDTSSHILPSPSRNRNSDSSPQADGAPPLRTTSNDAGIRANTLLSSLHMREVTTQALLYTGAFCLCTDPLLIRAFKLSSGTFIDVLIATFGPLNGFFTILIYTRPTIAHLRRGHPECSWLSAFILILKFSGSDSNHYSQHMLKEQIHDLRRRNRAFGGVANIHFVSSGLYSQVARERAAEDIVVRSLVWTDWT